MKISLNWLKEFVDIKDISTDEIISNLTMCGLEVEDVINQNEIYKNLIVGKILEKVKHPNADKLSVCKVSTGNNEFQVVCGASNVDANQKIVFAPIGTVIPNNKLIISKVKIRGVESFGMICSERELNLSDEHSGIMILPSNLTEGLPITDALGLNDVLMEIAVTPNRPDALSHIGVARDLAAIFNRNFSLPKINLNHSSKKISSYASVEIKDFENCPRYSAKVVLNVKVDDSPQWLKKKLESIGLRSINNIVDVTNLILNEVGQPLHGFDLDKLCGKKIIVKQASADSFFTTLDSKSRKLNDNILMICDGEKNVAVAGVMGGENSEVTPQTKNILIESAYFNPSSIRKTSKYLGLSTDASYRFERGCNFNITCFAAERAAQLISEIAGGEICDGIIDIYPVKLIEKEIFLRYKRVERILGFHINNEKINQILKNLGFEILSSDEEKLFVKIPSYRPDIEREIDIIEEIARINGYDNIPTVSRIFSTLENKIDESSFNNEIRNILTSQGFYEIYSNSFQSEKTASYYGNPIAIINPQSFEMSNLRTNLILGGLETVKRNLNVGEKNIKIFEIGKVFNKQKDEINSFNDFIEDENLLILISGKAAEKEWFQQPRNFDFYDLKGFVNSLLIKKRISNSLMGTFYNTENIFFDYHFTLSFENNLIGTGGKVNKNTLRLFDLNQDVFCIEINLGKIKTIQAAKPKYQDLLRFPKVHRDFSFAIDKNISAEDLKTFILKNASGIVKNVKLFDIFESEVLGENKKSVAFALEYFDIERTLTEEEVEKDFLLLIEKIKKEFSAVLRGN